jgi:putative oxidoreductase
MTRLLALLRTPAYTLLRFAFGALFWFHGAQKLFGWFGGEQAPLMSQMGLAGLIEFFGGLAIALGFLTSLAALIAAAEMVVAYSTVHAHRGALPIQNGGELALHNLFAFLFILIEGGGPWSIDQAIWPKRKR